MPYKDPEVKKAKHKEYSSKHYQANKTQVKAAALARKKESRAKWVEFKKGLYCMKCNQCHPATLDFHHVIRDGTKRTVSRLATSGQYDDAIEETKKCVVLCSNCHRILHHEERLELRIARKRKKKYLILLQNMLTCVESTHKGANRWLFPSYLQVKIPKKKRKTRQKPLLVDVFLSQIT